MSIPPTRAARPVDVPPDSGVRQTDRSAAVLDHPAYALEDEVLPPQHAWRLFGITPPAIFSDAQLDRFELDPSVDPVTMSPPQQVVRERYLAYRSLMRVYRISEDPELLADAATALYHAATASSWVVVDAALRTILQGAQVALHKATYELCDEALMLSLQGDLALEDYRNAMLTQLKVLQQEVLAGRHHSSRPSMRPAMLPPAAEPHQRTPATISTVPQRAVANEHLTPVTSRVATISTISAFPLVLNPLFRVR